MKIAVLGGGGLLGRHLVEELAGKHEVTARDRGGCDVADLEQVRAACAGAEVIVSAAAYTNVDGAEAEPDAAWRANALGSENVARVARDNGVAALLVSTDFVFDGAQTQPYDELEVPRPLGVYGRSKLGGERLAERIGGRLFVVRVQGLYGAGGRNFSSKLYDLVRRGTALKLDAERRVQPTWARSAARAIAWLAASEHYGLYHVSCSGETTWAGFARLLAERLGVAPAWQEVSSAALATPSPRPPNCLFDHRMWSLRGGPALPDWRDALGEYLEEMKTR